MLTFAAAKKKSLVSYSTAYTRRLGQLQRMPHPPSLLDFESSGEKKHLQLNSHPAPDG
jgi:hypothetical protein